MQDNTAPRIPPTLRDFVFAVPSPEAIRAELARKKHEAAFPKRLLKLSISAQYASGQKGADHA
ncbi:MAG: hypothetical protein EXS05_16640 [Planctomycetaceae bacterium]|nr:hypothetical protein [Planctomycetaceae bacterium]